jgi:hypothetical protein
LWHAIFIQRKCCLFVCSRACLAKDERYRNIHIFRNFSKAAKELKAEALAPFLDALPGVAAKLSPCGVSHVTFAIGSFSKVTNTSPDKHNINALLTAILQTAPEMNPADLVRCTLAFKTIPLPFDSPAGHALLAELPRGMKRVNKKMLAKVMIGLASAEVAFSEELMDALWTALKRVAPFFTLGQLLNALGHTAFLQNQGVIPEEVRTVLLQEVLRCAPLLDLRKARATVKWLNLLDWEAPDEVFARQRCSVQ